MNGNYGMIGYKEENTLLGKKQNDIIDSLLLCEKHRLSYVLCHSLELNDKKTSETLLNIPITYNGWFEILSEGGKSIEPLKTVHDLHSHAINLKKKQQIINTKNTSKNDNDLIQPKFIVRENIVGYLIPDSLIYIQQFSKRKYSIQIFI
jgi:hypothetical protein